MSLALDLLCAIFFKSTFELSKKFYPYCYKDAVDNLKTLPFDVVGIPFLVIILPVLSILFDLDPALDPELVPIFRNPVFNLPPVKGLIIGFTLELFLKEVPTFANLFFYSYLIIISAMPYSSVSN
jgi:hypothetical protein